jgi:hypothetical protein
MNIESVTLSKTETSAVGIGGVWGGCGDEIQLTVRTVF